MQRLSLHLRADTTRNIETFQAACRSFSVVDMAPRLAHLAPSRPTVFIPADRFVVRSAMSRGSEGRDAASSLRLPSETSVASSYIVVFLHRMIRRHSITSITLSQAIEAHHTPDNYSTRLCVRYQPCAGLPVPRPALD